MADNDIQIKPPQAACQVVADVLNTTYQIKLAWKKIREIIIQIKTIKAQALWGIFLDILSLVGAELLAAIKAAAAAMAATAIANASSVLSKILQSIFEKILAILIAYPEAIYSLVSLPLDLAISSGEREQVFLKKARGELDIIIDILNKWSKGVDGTRFYDQMKSAIPHIRKAMTNMQDMIIELYDADNTTNGPGRNAVFNESKYSAVIGELKKAIQITKPEDTVLFKNIGSFKKNDSYFENERNRRYKDVEIKYKEYVREHDKEREEKLFNLSQSTKDDDEDRLFSGPEKQADYRVFIEAGGDFEYIEEAKKNIVKTHAEVYQPNSLENALAIRKIDLEWEAGIKRTDLWRSNERIKIDADITKMKYKNNSDLARKYNGISEEFKYDMATLGNALESLLTKYIKLAYWQYKTCQIATNSVYNIRELISSLIEQAIWLLRQSGNASATLAIAALQLAYSTSSTADYMFQKEVDAYEKNDKESRTSSAKMSATLGVGNALLQGAYGTLRATITESLIDLINSDDFLESENEVFNQFLQRIHDIPDWKTGAKGIWGVSPLAGSVAPYIQLIADLTEMLIKVPIYSVSFRDKERQKARQSIVDVENTMGSLEYHNKLVLGVLRSYVPFKSDEAGDLEKMLGQLGLIAGGAFALTLSLVNLINDIRSISGIDTSEAVPNEKNCIKNYPELFHEGLVAEYERKKANAKRMDLTSDANAQNEKKEEEFQAYKRKRMQENFLSVNKFEQSDYNDSGVTSDEPNA